MIKMDDISSLPTVSLVTIMHNWSNFCKLFKYTWETLDYPKEKMEWIIVDDSREDHSNLIPIDDKILYIRIDPDDFLDKIDFKDKKIKAYFNKCKRLPNGFMRDYSVGLTSNEYILHVDYDTIYRPNTIHRKLRFLTKNKLECVYCMEMLAYDIYGKQFYKVKDEMNGYSSTLFHTKDFWNRGGFKWEDINNEASSFYYGKGLERKLENYYDSIKILSIHNLNRYKPIKLSSLENIDTKLPNVLDELNISEHPTSDLLYDIFNNKEINVIGLESNIMDIIQKENWSCNNITDERKKVKEKVIISKIKKLNKDIHLCIINTKYPIWSIFKEINFDIVILESNKNFEQMDSILKGNNYLFFDNLYFNSNFLLK